MTNIVRIAKKRDYTVLDNGFIRDTRLSFKATGLLAYLLHLPSDWQVSTKDLQTKKTDGRDSIAGAMKELITYNYVEYTKAKNDKGQWEHLYVVHETPMTSAVDPQTGNPYTGNPRTGNPFISESTEELNTNELNTKSSESDSIPQPFQLQQDNFLGMIEEFKSRRPRLVESIDKFLTMRKKKGLSKDRLKVILEDILYYLQDDEEAVAEILIATEGGYGQVVNDFLVEKFHKGSKRTKADNTTVKTFTDNKVDTEVKLATGENGELLKF